MNRRHSVFFLAVNLNEMVMCLEDLINYFAQPEDDMGKSKHPYFQMLIKIFEFRT